MKNSWLIISLACCMQLNAHAFQLKDSLLFSQEAKNKAIERLKLMKERIAKGVDFNSLATLYSDDPGSRSKGGCYDSIRRGAFVPEFEAVAFKLKVGEVSDIFETKYGFHIMILRARRGDEVDVCHILIIPK